MGKRTRHSFEFKKKIVDEHESGGGTAQELGRKYKVHPTNVYQWAKKLSTGQLIDGPTAKECQQSKEIEYDKKKVAELTRDLDLLKKLQEEISQRQKRSGGLGGILKKSGPSVGPAK